MSANFLLRDWPAIAMAPLCPGFAPHWAQNGLLEAAGGGVGGGGLELLDPLPQARSSSEVISNSEKKQTCFAFPNTKLRLISEFPICKSECARRGTRFRITGGNSVHVSHFPAKLRVIVLGNNKPHNVGG